MRINGIDIKEKYCENPSDFEVVLHQSEPNCAAGRVEMEINLESPDTSISIDEAGEVL